VGHRADAVIHVLTALKNAPLFYGSMNDTNRLRQKGTENLIEAAHVVGARRMLTQSIVFGYGFRTPHPSVVDESAPFAVAEGTGVDPTLAALASTETQVRDGEGLDGIALRYGLFYGLDAAMIERMLRRRMLPVTSFDGRIPYVHHEDAASATVAALERGVAGRAYNVSGDNGSSWRHAIEAAARAFGAPAPMVLPTALVRAAIPYAGELMTRLDLQVSSQLAKRELGWSPTYPTVDEGWKASRVE
jgi:nucleoside-diphosphate-sugar epimerase